MKSELMHVNNLLTLIKGNTFKLSGLDALALAAAWKWLMERKAQLEHEEKLPAAPPLFIPTPAPTKKGKKK